VSGRFQYDEPSSVVSCKRLSFHTDKMTDKKTLMPLAIFVIILFILILKEFFVSRFALDDTGSDIGRLKGCHLLLVE
jgi:hypothetical protein